MWILDIVCVMEMTFITEKVTWLVSKLASTQLTLNLKKEIKCKKLVFVCVCKAFCFKG